MTATTRPTSRSLQTLAYTAAMILSGIPAEALRRAELPVLAAAATVVSVVLAMAWFPIVTAIWTRR